jgi:hypothetical protein
MKLQPELFPELKPKTKIEIFENALEEYIFSKKDKISNLDLYNFTLDNGHIPKHAINVIRKLKKQAKIFYKGHPKINYGKCIRENDIIYFEVNEHEED